MVLGFSEDFSSGVTLDSQLKDIPSSGLYLNRGVHPSINLDNILSFLPKHEFTFQDWNAGTTYNSFLTSMNRVDIVTSDGVIYQSIKAVNTNNAVTDTQYWIPTNIESLRLKVFINSVENRVYSDLSLTKRLVNNQYLYTIGDTLKTIPNDYMGWVLEPKGSDYVSIRVNEMSLQKDGTTPVNVYVINQNQLLSTITLTPDNGRLSFRDTDITFSGKGDFKLIIDSTEVYVSNETINPLKFDGFVAYTTIGDGDTPAGAKYTYNTFDNGLGLNVSVFMDSTNYIDNNVRDLSAYVRATFEYMVFETFLANANNRSNRAQRLQMNDDLLTAQLMSVRSDSNTVASRYQKERKRAIATMRKTFDTQLNDHDGLEITVGSV
tara:strand:+ start:3181 stop:4314 length:1134 start_codon:yes stop_codon:yes gene_type:complete